MNGMILRQPKGPRGRGRERCPSDLGRSTIGRFPRREGLFHCSGGNYAKQYARKEET